MDDYEVQLRRARVRKMLLIGGVLFVLVTAPCAILGWNTWSVEQEVAEIREAASHTATDEQIARVQAAVTAFDAALDARVGPWSAAMAHADDAVADPALGPCPFEVPLPRTSPTRPYEEEGMGPSGLVALTPSGGRVIFARERDRAFAYALVRDGQLPEQPPGVERLRERGRTLLRRIENTGRVEDFASMVRSADALQGTRPVWDAAIVLREVREPVARGETFDAGRLVAHAVVYDYAAEAIACATTVVVEPHSVSAMGLETMRPMGSASVVDPSEAFESALWLVLEDALERQVARTMQHRARVP